MTDYTSEGSSKSEQQQQSRPPTRVPAPRQLPPINSPPITPRTPKGSHQRVQPVSEQSNASTNGEASDRGALATCGCGLLNLLFKRDASDEKRPSYGFLRRPSSSKSSRRKAVAPAEFDISFLTTEQHARLKNAFHVFDQDGNGSISRNELLEGLRIMGHSPTMGEFDDLYKSLDEDNSNNLEFTEFATIWWKHENDRRESEFSVQMELAFKVFDANGDGMISADELRNKLTTLGDVMSHSEVDELLAHADPNQDGVITMEEFRGLPCWR